MLLNTPARQHISSREPNFEGCESKHMKIMSVTYTLFEANRA